MEKNNIMSRMKDHYELRNKSFLTRRIPIIIRLDGCHFRTFTKGLNKPFDECLIEDMQKTTIYLCEQIQGCKAAYIQSDEISLLLTDYENLNTEAWFNYEVQKMTSISASLATGKFNQLRIERKFNIPDWNLLSLAHLFDNFKLANFDSRVFTIPKDEVSNYFLARQLDAEKNSIAMLAQSMYSHKELHGKHGGEMQEMCFQKGVNWNDLHFSKKRGSFIVKNTYVNGELYEIRNNKLYYPEPYDRWVELTKEDIIRTKWEVVETPMRFNHSHFEKWL